MRKRDTIKSWKINAITDRTVELCADGVRIVLTIDPEG